MTKSNRLTIISADTHAGGSHEQYREYLDPEFRDEFDAWRGQYKNPWKDLRDTDLQVRNWDNERRDLDQLGDGVVGEVIFPNTVPPFYPGSCYSPLPQARRIRTAPGGHPGAQPLDGGFLRRRPARRAGVAQFFLNDIDDAIADITWIKEQGLRGGVLSRRWRRTSVVGQAPLSPGLRPLVGDYSDFEVTINLHARHRLTQLWPVQRRPNDHDLRGGLLRGPSASST